MPSVCPACGTELTASGKYWLCPNRTRCAPQVAGRTEVLAGRTGFDIDRLGKKLIRQLVEVELLRSPADVFHLDPVALLELERWGRKSVDNLMKQLAQRRQVPFERYLVGLGIPEVGRATARLIARNFASLGALMAADADELQSLDGIGPEMAQALGAFFADPASRKLMQRLEQGGVEIVHTPSPSSQGEGAFADKAMVFTGTLEQLSRAEAKALAEEQGARVASSVSKKTDFLVIGANPGSKRKKAAELGVAILTEADFLARVGRS